MFVYIVEENVMYEDTIFSGVFSTKQKAEEWVRLHDPYGYKEKHKWTIYPEEIDSRLIKEIRR